MTAITIPYALVHTFTHVNEKVPHRVNQTQRAKIIMHVHNLRISEVSQYMANEHATFQGMPTSALTRSWIKYGLFLRFLFSQGVYFERPRNRYNRVVTTLDDRGREVYELDGGTLIDGVWTGDKVLEWFRLNDLDMLFMAIDCRFTSPIYSMYSGLDTAGNNL